MGPSPFCYYVARFAPNIPLYFEDQPPIDADILIAADGSGSRVNQQVGLNNKVKLQQWSLFQARGIIGKDARQDLPASLRENGAVMFLGGRAIAGFTSIYRVPDSPSPDDSGEQKEDNYSLFWSMVLPTEQGQAISEKADGNQDKIIPQLCQHIRQDLQLGEALPTVCESVQTHLQQSLLTSSFKPTSDWRQGKKANSRIILLGDALHPMTPGRGMGANQALTDAGKLVDLFRASKFEPGMPIEAELPRLVTAFDTEMYDRAFKMVKESEKVVDLDLSLRSGRAKVAVVGVVLTVLGCFVSMAEALGLKQPESFDYAYRTT